MRFRNKTRERLLIEGFGTIPPLRDFDLSLSRRLTPKLINGIKILYRSGCLDPLDRNARGLLGLDRRLIADGRVLDLGDSE